jgi:unsaturated chondroitin disaccharide hydrolase
MGPDLDQALRRVLERCVAAGVEVPAGRYPVWADDTGNWQSAGPDHWAAGFATGARRLAAVCGSPAPRTATGPPVVPSGIEISSFHAFTGWYAGPSSEAARIGRLLAAAMLPSGALAVTEGDLRGPGHLVVAYVDALGPAAALLAAEVGAEVGARHARWTLQTLQRPDGSLFQSALVDPTTGTIVDTVFTAAQGFDRASRWSRAQAWGLLGAAMAPPESVTLAGQRLADWWLAHAPGDSAPLWDFDAPRGGPVDTSAGAIAATAFLRLAGRDRGPRSAEYGRAGLKLLQALVGHVDARGALLDGCYHRPAGLAPANELIWGDYYLAEALGLATGLLSMPETL